ncbi:Uncharacterised protein [Candidatus Bartonella washoeensis]|uniref:Uncharacterized protein n=1 Tax=Candidatus Bartonella washoeensis Sb944nv TaxID=1094563 RepID=J0QAW1_9HYPH|nr:hypothetical protein MCQ_00616 [Bartonella washoeensis Sb944nv]SPU26864.1 Uncharacterised protein [Bartonella washoeensis]
MRESYCIDGAHSSCKMMNYLYKSIYCFFDKIILKKLASQQQTLSKTITFMQER